MDRIEIVRDFILSHLFIYKYRFIADKISDEKCHCCKVDSSVKTILLKSPPNLISYKDRNYILLCQKCFDFMMLDATSH